MARGRPRKPINSTQVERLASYGLVTSEISAVFGCSADTVERRFADALSRGRARRNVSLRRMQLASARRGSTAMLIWLGKQYLGQRDDPPPEHKSDTLTQLLNEFRKRYKQIEEQQVAEED